MSDYRKVCEAGLAYNINFGPSMTAFDSVEGA